MSAIAALIAEISEPCSTCGGSGNLAVITAPARTERHQVTERGIAIVGEPALIEIPARTGYNRCPACHGGGRQMSAAGHELRETLLTLLRDEFAAYDHGHTVS
jgi:hypothetical protein